MTAMRYGPGVTMALGVLAFALAGCQQPAPGRPGTGVEPAAFGSGAPGGALDPEDRMLVNAAAQHALETAPDGTPVGWTNPSSGHSGAVMPMRSYQTGDGLRCRVFRQTIAGDGQLQRSAGTACRQADGSWKVVDS